MVTLYQAHPAKTKQSVLQYRLDVHTDRWSGNVHRQNTLGPSGQHLLICLFLRFRLTPFN